MLTISQVAAYAGVTVRAVRHYHAKGLLPEPDRDHSGYRRYDAGAVVELIKIRTLADAGVPLSRVNELLHADEQEFAVAIAQIDRRLRAEIRERQEHRRRIAQLAVGHDVALPDEVVAYLERLREHGVPAEMIALERDAWILAAARWPEQIPAIMADKQAQLDDPRVLRLYGLFQRVATEWEIDPTSAAVEELLNEVADCLHDLFEDASANGRLDLHQPLDLSYNRLMDSLADDAHPVVGRLRTLMDDRGWVGWTRMERRA